MKRILITFVFIFVLLAGLVPAFSQKQGGSKSSNVRSKDALKARKEARNRLRHSQKQRQLHREQLRKRQSQAGAASESGLRTRKQKGNQKGMAKGAQHHQQLQSLEKQLVREQQKHQNRITRLNRIHQLAGKKNNTKLVERVGGLLEKEQLRYERKQQRMDEKKQKVMQLVEKSLMESLEKSLKEKAEKGKPNIENTEPE